MSGAPGASRLGDVADAHHRAAPALANRKDLEGRTLGAALVLPLPTGGALALADILKFPGSETNSFCPCTHAEAIGLRSASPDSLQTPWGKSTQMGTPSILEVLLQPALLIPCGNLV